MRVCVGVLICPSVAVDSLSLHQSAHFLPSAHQTIVAEHEIRNISCAAQDPDDLCTFAYITKDLKSGHHFCHVFSTVEVVSNMTPSCWSETEIWTHWNSTTVQWFEEYPPQICIKIHINCLLGSESGMYFFQEIKSVVSTLKSWKAPSNLIKNSRI